VAPPGGNSVRRAGHTLSIFNKQADGRWRLARDANFLSEQT
jgi:ketosteroid isomerase-like protein